MADPSCLAWALKLAQMGCFILRVKRGSKRPAESEWQLTATRDPILIRKMFADYPDTNYGVTYGYDLLAVDVDCKKGAPGLASLAALEGSDWETMISGGATFTVKTPSGGYHFILKTQVAVENSQKGKFAKGIDIKGFKGQTLGPGSELIEGLCDDGDVPGFYTVEFDRPFLDAPGWVNDRVTKVGTQKTKEQVEADIDLELDLPENIEIARQHLLRRKFAISGQSGDEHTYVTAAQLIDYGLTAQAAYDLMQEDLFEGNTKSWNDMCEPPWPLHGAASLEAKCISAFKNRKNKIGGRAGEGGMFDWLDKASAAAPSDGPQPEGFTDEYFNQETKKEEATKEQTRSYILDHLFQGKAILERGVQQDFMVPRFIPGHGIVALLAIRSTGKTVMMIDLAMRACTGKDWHGSPMKEKLYSIYLCGEDDVGAEEIVRAWCKVHNNDKVPENFFFLDIMTNLMKEGDIQQYIDAIRTKIPDKEQRCMVFLDTWQRATAAAGQSDDKEMQIAISRAEQLAKEFKGPAITAFHPPKNAEKTGNMTVIGSSIIENTTTAIINLTSVPNGQRKIEVQRIKGARAYSTKMFEFKIVGLGMPDEFGEERSSVYPVFLEGPEDGIKFQEAQGWARIVTEADAIRRDEHSGTGRLGKLSPASLADFITEKKTLAATVSQDPNVLAAKQFIGLVTEKVNPEKWAALAVAKHVTAVFTKFHRVDIQTPAGDTCTVERVVTGTVSHFEITVNSSLQQIADDNAGQTSDNATSLDAAVVVDDDGRLDL